jgi:GrpB-like predicted nucleotidyltransferase (UPF0157 family)
MGMNRVEYLRGRDSLNGRVELVEYDAGWTEIFSDLRADILSALGSSISRLEHVGSTSVPGLASKPVIDIVLLVKDSAAEETYIPRLEAVGFLHHLREPGWFEHRLLKHKVHQVNLHVFSAGCEEATRMIRFRDYLRSNQDGRIEYEQIKRKVADQKWTFMQDYADAKGKTIRVLLSQLR